MLWEVIFVNKYLQVRNSKSIFILSLNQKQCRNYENYKGTMQCHKTLTRTIFTAWLKQLWSLISKKEWKRINPFIIDTSHVYYNSTKVKVFRLSSPFFLNSKHLLGFIWNRFLGFLPVHFQHFKGITLTKKHRLN